MFFRAREEKLDNISESDIKINDKINSSVVNRKPALLAMLLVDILKENGWSADDIHFLGSEIINESGVL
jgi:hypothetical protein